MTIRARAIAAFLAALFTVSSAVAARAQDEPPEISVRPFVMGAVQAFSAVHTFEAVFGEARQPFFGGGAQVVFNGRFYAELSASRFKKTGERAFRADGQNFGLDLPITAEITPFEVTGGYRFHFAGSPRIVPHGAAGFGSYAYEETSPSSDPAENLKTRHSGFVVNGGVEFRVHRWVGIGVDVQYTHIPGILGSGGVSKIAGEDDLGGVAAQFKAVVGR
jgi:hypothetical protein